MTKNYKILTSYVKDISSKINDTESYIYLKDNIPKYSLGIDINSIPLKSNMAEVNIKLTFDNKSEKNKTDFWVTEDPLHINFFSMVNKENQRRFLFFLDNLEKQSLHLAR